MTSAELIARLVRAFYEGIPWDKLTPAEQAAFSDYMARRRQVQP